MKTSMAASDDDITAEDEVGGDEGGLGEIRTSTATLSSYVTGIHC